MPGFSLRTNLDADMALQISKQVAQRLDYSVTPLGDRELGVQKGSRIMSMVLRPLFRLSDFPITINRRQDNSVEIDINRNAPGWTGIIAVKRATARAQELAD